MQNAGAIVVTQDERTLGTLAQVLQLVGGWIGPLVIFFIKRDSKFVRFHALQALLLQGIYLLLWGFCMAGWLAMVSGTIFRGDTMHANQPPPLFFVYLPVIVLLGLGGGIALVVVAIVYGIKASRGEWAKYPLLGDWAARILKIEFL